MREKENEQGYKLEALPKEGVEKEGLGALCTRLQRQVVPNILTLIQK